MIGVVVLDPPPPAGGDAGGGDDASFSLTVSVAALLVASPWLLLKTARYACPLFATFVLSIVSVSVVAPGTSVHLLFSVDSCHWTFGFGEPDASATNVALTGSVTLSLAG